MQTSLFQPTTTTLAPAAQATLIPKDRHDLRRLVYGNGENNPATIVMHEDPGHGWLQVPKSLLKQLGITNKITGYSYQRGEFAYLEEDCDLGTFVVALGLIENGLMKDFWQVVPNDHKENTPIRSYSRFNSK